MPKELISTFEVLWQTAMEQAQNQLLEYKQAVELEREVLLQKDRDTSKLINETTQKIVDLTASLEQEIANKQKLDIELAVTSERVSKQADEFILQRNQYEDRLKRIYEEKDIVITQCHQLQNDVKLLQEKISLQAEQYQKSVAQHNASHEQSENRWVKLIDQAKDETKNIYKKIENMRTTNDIASKKLKVTIVELQQVIYEKNAQLNVSVNQVSQLKQDIKMLESEIIKTKSIIMKLEDERKLQNTIISKLEKNHHKIEEISQLEAEVSSE